MKRYVQVAAIVALVLAFGAAGLAKLVDAASFSQQFAHLGLPRWWIHVTGALELLGAALVALPIWAARRSGAALLAATMAVASALHLAHDPAPIALPALALMLLAGYVASMPRPLRPARGLAGA